MELRHFNTRVLLNIVPSNALHFLWSTVIQSEPAQTSSDTDTTRLQTKSISLMGKSLA